MKQPSRPGTCQSSARRKTRAELNLEGRERKRQKKRRGNSAGNRANTLAGQQEQGTSAKPSDPRFGSKKPVPLIAEGKVSLTPAEPVTDSAPQKLTRQQELTALENNPRLDHLLDRLESGETLSPDEQGWLGTTLDRIEELMVLLGIELDDENQHPQVEEDMYRLLKGQ